MGFRIRLMHRKNIFRFLSIFVIIIMVLGFKVGLNFKIQAAELTEPSFSILDLSYTPENPKVGEDITVKGEIIPNDFVTSVPENDIVLVLDVSGSMNDKIQVQCLNNAVDKQCTEQRGDYCVQCGKYVNEGHNEERPYANHRVGLGRYGYYCYDCQKYINVDVATHRNEQPYKNHTVEHDYCAVHNKVGEHSYKFVSDSSYCEEHHKRGSHTYQSTKLEELKKAANNFIEKMRNIPSVKIGIVAYSSYAWVNPHGIMGEINTTSLDTYAASWYGPTYTYHKVPNYYSVGNNLLNINDSRLHEMINKLVAQGGTNTGDGMRKGVALLKNGRKNAKKTMILMSDGLPTFYSVNGMGYDYYTNEDFYNPNYRGTGNSDKDSSCLNYATIIGNKVKEESINAFTIGYGLDNDGNIKMRKIHNSMTEEDLSDDAKSDEEKGFFATSNDEAIDSVFSAIGDKILNEYQINKIKLNLNMPEEFSLNIGGNVVNLSNIIYKLKEDRGDKLLYSAEPVSFSFRIKSSKAGEFKDVFNGSTSSFQWNEKIIHCELGGFDINILNNGTPIITAELDANTTSFIGSGPFNVNYTIKPEEFKIDNKGDSNLSYDEAAVKDVAILVDESIPKEQVYNSIVNNILSDSYFSQKETRYSLIVYGKDGYKYYKLDDYWGTNSQINNAYNNMGTDKNVNNEKYSSAIKELVQIVSKNLGKESSDSSIKGALDKAIELLEGGRKEVFTEKIDKDRNDLESNKNIVIIGRSNISDIGAIDKLNPNYKVITFNYGKINAATKDCDNNIKSLHYSLTGKKMRNSVLDKKSDYYYINMNYNNYIDKNYNDNNDNSFFADSNNIGGTDGNEKNNIQNSIMGNIKEDLKDSNTNVLQIVNSYEFKAKLKFQVGSDIEVTELNSSESPYDKESKEILVKYTLDKSDGYYKAPEQIVSFPIKPVVKNKSKLTFGKNNSLVYKDLDDEDMISHIETPVINMYTPKHGVYIGKDTSTNNYNIITSKHVFKKNSFGTFAAEIKYIRNGDNIRLTLPDGIELVNGEPEIWKLVNGQLSKTGITLVKDNYDNSYSGSVNNVFTESDDNMILVIYTVKMPGNEISELTNKITVNNGLDSYAKYQVSEELPDLF